MSSVKEITTNKYTLFLDPADCMANVYMNTLAFVEARKNDEEAFLKLFVTYQAPGKESDTVRRFVITEKHLEEYLSRKEKTAEVVENDINDDEDDEEIKERVVFVEKYLPELYKEIIDHFEAFLSSCKQQAKEGKMDVSALAWMLARCSSGNNEHVGTNILSCQINGTEIAAKLRRTYERANQFGVRWLELELEFLWLRGMSIVSSETSIKIPLFSSKKTLEEVGIKFISDENLESFYIRGLKVAESAKKYIFKNFEGNMYIPRGYMGTAKLFTKTRMVVDGQICYEENKLSNLHNDESTSFNLEETEIGDIEKRDISRLSPYLPGFDLKNKRWGYVNIEELKDIVFRKDALDKLVIDEDDKSLLSSIAEIEHLESKDVIDGKGGGAIFLLTGKPGVGKTLTAEAIAETQGKPLYMVSVGELGTDVSNLEDSMKSILAVAEKWNAILLIDEVDIFLEQRDTNNIQRNAMVGVFLRTLEYYAGILFLTTNRVGNLDQAFYSRVSLSLHYKELDHETRKKIFENQLALYGVNGTVDINEIVRYCDKHDIRINGRQIKNTVRMVYAISAQQKREVMITDFERVLNKIKEFESGINK